MIQNEHQYRLTRSRLQELEKAVAELWKIKDSLRPRQFSARKRGLEASLETLCQEIREYESLKSQQAPIKIRSIQELPLALIKARIALGMTQRELAERMGVKQQQVQRDEAELYSSAGFHRVASVAAALGLQIPETDVWLESLPR